MNWWGVYCLSTYTFLDGTARNRGGRLCELIKKRFLDIMMSVIDDPTTIVPVVFLCCGIMYALLQTLLAIGLLTHREIQSSRVLNEQIAVIIAARNEADDIGQTLDALLAQTVLPHEIVVVDDRSTDDTAAIVRSYAHRDQRVRLVQVTTLPVGLAPKKHALQQGIETTRCSLLCFTDADCTPPPAWIEYMTGAFDASTGVVVGTYVPQQKGSADMSFLQRLLTTFTRYEKLRTTLLAAGALELGHPWMASGASLAYRRIVYDEVGGYSGHMDSVSGDDDLFIQRVHSRTRWSIRMVLSDQATVRTRVPELIADFIRQRTRHFSAGRAYRFSTQVFLALYHVMNIISLSSLFVWFWLSSPLILGAFTLKVCADLFLFVSSERHISRSHDWSLFLLMEFIFVLYIVLIGPVGFVATPSWKDRQSDDR